MAETQTPLGNPLATSRYGVLLTAGFAVTIAAILFSMWVAYDNLRTVRETRDQVMSSRQIITELASVMSTMKDAETGQRGYVITGEQEYLEPYENAISTVHQHVAALKTLTADDPQQRASLTTLETHITRKLGELENAIALRRGKGPDAASSMVKTGLGHQAMNDIRRLVAEMQEVEGRTLAQRQTNEDRSYKRGFSSSLLAGLLALGVAIAAYVLLRRDAVARQQAQNALRLSAQQLREASDRLTLAQQAARVGSFEWNIQTNLNIWTPELETLYGLSPGTFGRTMEDWIQRVHVDDRKAALEANRKAVESCGEFSAEFRIVWPDGSIHWMSGRGKVITDDAGRALRLVGVNIDITERKQAEELLRRNERNLSDFYDKATIALHWVGPDGIILRANQTELDMLGYSREEYVGRHIADFHVDQPVIKDILTRLTCGESLHEYPARLRCKDGSIRDVLINSNALFEDGKFIHTRCLTRDITGHKQSERALAHLASIVTSSDDAIITKNLQGIVLSWNRAAERLFGYTAEEMIGQPVKLLIPPERHDEEPYILSCIARGEPIDHYETVRRRKDGTLIDISLTVSPMVDGKGKIIGASKIARDISEQKRVLKALARANQNLQKQAAALADANKELEAFSYSVSHDLRAPLRTIDAFSRMVAEDYGHELNPEAQRYVMVVRKAASQAGELIDDLLELSRLGRQAMQTRQVDMAKLARESIEELTWLHEGRAIGVTIPDLPPCLGDPRLLKLVWTNLLGNALKYTKYREAATVEVGWLPDDRPDTVVYSVKDNGVGFDMKYVHKLFGVFQRLHSKEEFEGTGVGLAIVQRIIHRHEGRVWAEGKVDGGATFFFSLRKASV